MKTHAPASALALHAAFALAWLLTFSCAQALPSSGSLFISLPNSSVVCARIVLPDDMGSFQKGKVEYNISMSPPDPEANWGGMTHQSLRTDENNTVIIPICFSSVGRRIGECSKSFTIRITSPQSGLEKTWAGGVCASSHLDFDTARPVQPGQPADGAEGLGDADVFSMGFLSSQVHATPGQTVAFRLFIESYASLDIDIAAQSSQGLSVQPSSRSIRTSPENSFHEIEFNASSQQPGSHTLTVTAAARNCGSGSYCTRQAIATLEVGQEQPDLEGFTVSVFPENINVKELRPVAYRLTVSNMGQAREFSIAARLPEGMESTFVPMTVTVPSNDYRSIMFTVTPTSPASTYQLDFSANTSSLSKPATVYLSTDEMLTDAMRSVEIAEASGSGSQASQELDRWYRTYAETGYGDDLEGYSGLQASLDAASQQPGTGQGGNETIPSDGGWDTNGTSPDNGTTGFNLLGKDFWVVLVAAAVLLVAGFLASTKLGKKSRLDEEFDMGKGF